jgi:predicted methyltransferase MtxX (methanogen marker protein 4)
MGAENPVEHAGAVAILAVRALRRATADLHSAAMTGGGYGDLASEADRAAEDAEVLAEAIASRT